MTSGFTYALTGPSDDMANACGFTQRNALYKTRRCRGVTYPESYITKYTTYIKIIEQLADDIRTSVYGKNDFGDHRYDFVIFRAQASDIRVSSSSSLLLSSLDTKVYEP